MTISRLHSTLDSLCWALPCVILFSGPAWARQNANPTYERDLKPLLKKHCTACHNGRKVADVDASGGLALDNYELIQTARSKKPALFTQGDKSALLQRLTTTEDEKRMPQGGEALAAAEIALVRRWLETGMKRGDPVASSSTSSAEPKTNWSRQRPVLFTTSFQTPKGFMGGLAPQLQIRLSRGSMAPITALTFSPDGKVLAVGSYKQVVLWDLESAKPRSVLADFPGAVHDLHFTPDGNQLLVAGGQPAVEGHVWLYDFGQAKWTKMIQMGQDVVTSAAFDPSGKAVALGSSDKKIYLYDLEKNAIKRTLTGHSDGVTAVAYTPNGEWLLSAAKDRSVKITSTKTGDTKQTLTGTNDEELALAVHPDGKRAVSSGAEPNLNWWDLAGGKRERRIQGHAGAINDMAFDRSGDLLVTASSDQTVRLWDGKNGAAIRTLKTNTILYAVSVLPDGSKVAAGGFDGSTMIWDVKSGRQLITLTAFRDAQGLVQWLAFIPEGYVSASPGAKTAVNWNMNKSYTQSHTWELLENPGRIAQALRAPAQSKTSATGSSRGKP